MPNKTGRDKQKGPSPSDAKKKPAAQPPDARDQPLPRPRNNRALGAQKGRQSEVPVSRGGMTQESRQANK